MSDHATYVYLSTSELENLTVGEIVDFARRELNVELDDSRTKAVLLGQLYRLGTVEELGGAPS